MRQPTVRQLQDLVADWRDVAQKNEDEDGAYAMGFYHCIEDLDYLLEAGIYAKDGEVRDE